MKYKTKTNMIIVSIVVIVTVFYGGMKFGQSQNKRGGLFAGGQGFQQGQNGMRGTRTGVGMRGGSGVVGQIVSVDDKNITVQTRDGSSKIVFLAESTSVTKSAPGSIQDLKAGQQITVMGTANSDGSETAQFIQIRPEESAK